MKCLYNSLLDGEFLCWDFGVVPLAYATICYCSNDCDKK
jgi:hypothetical protein